MQRLIVWVLFAILLGSCSQSGKKEGTTAEASQTEQVVKATIQELLAQPADYDGKEVVFAWKRGGLKLCNPVALLNDIDAKGIGRPGESPRYSVMSCDTAPTLQRRTEYRITSVSRRIQMRNGPFDLVGVNDFSVNAV